MLKVDGGMTANDLLMQFQADVLDVPVVRPTIAETTCLGAAYAAGLAVGFWPDLETLRAQWRVDARWTPSMSAAARSRGARIGRRLWPAGSTGLSRLRSWPAVPSIVTVVGIR